MWPIVSRARITSFRLEGRWDEDQLTGSLLIVFICICLFFPSCVSLFGNNTYATKKKKKSCLNAFFSATSFVVTQKNFPPGLFGWKDSFSPLKLRFTNQILAFFGGFGLLYNTVFTLELPRRTVGFIGVFWPLSWGRFDMEVPMGFWRDDTRTPVSYTHLTLPTIYSV